MGFEMAGRLAKGGCDIAVWNRTRAKAEPLARYGAKVVDSLGELAGRDIVFCMVSTWDDVKSVMQQLPAAARSRRWSWRAPRSRWKVRPSSERC